MTLSIPNRSIINKDIQKGERLFPKQFSLLGAMIRVRLYVMDFQSYQANMIQTNNYAYGIIFKEDQIETKFRIYSIYWLATKGTSRMGELVFKRDYDDGRINIVQQSFRTQSSFSDKQ